MSNPWKEIVVDIVKGMNKESPHSSTYWSTRENDMIVIGTRLKSTESQELFQKVRPNRPVTDGPVWDYSPRFRPTDWGSEVVFELSDFVYEKNGQERNYSG